MDASLAAGEVDGADAFLYWSMDAGRVNRPRLPPAGRSTVGPPRPIRCGRAASLRHSGPVRSGNEEAEQHPLDGYGWIVDAAWQYHRVRGHISRETWRLVRQLADFVAGHWGAPDAGI